MHARHYSYSPVMDCAKYGSFFFFPFFFFSLFSSLYENSFELHEIFNEFFLKYRAFFLE